MEISRLQKLSIKTSLATVFLTILIAIITFFIYLSIGGQFSKAPDSSLIFRATKTPDDSFVIFWGVILEALVILCGVIATVALFFFAMTTARRIKSGGWNKAYLINALLILIPLFVLLFFINLLTWFWKGFETTL